MSDYRLVVDAARCDAHGICALKAPESIALDRWGYPQTDPAPLTSARRLRRARRAVAACPNAALVLAAVQTGPVTVPSVVDRSR